MVRHHVIQVALDALLLRDLALHLAGLRPHRRHRLLQTRHLRDKMTLSLD